MLQVTGNHLLDLQLATILKHLEMCEAYIKV